MNVSQNRKLPQIVIFEGVDGTGKTTLVNALANYYRKSAPDTLLYADSLPGSIPGTVGKWIYRLHDEKAIDTPPLEGIAPPALQLLHIAAHVDTILNRIRPILAHKGNIILDRFWWSPYVYSRNYLPPEKVWPLVNAERVFWDQLPQPIVIYLTRRISLKLGELDPMAHRQLDSHYREVMEIEQQSGVCIHELSNDGSLENTWINILKVLDLPYSKVELSF
jgi:thymidylate kinase